MYRSFLHDLAPVLSVKLVKRYKYTYIYGGRLIQDWFYMKMEAHFNSFLLMRDCGCIGRNIREWVLMTAELQYECLRMFNAQSEIYYSSVTSIEPWMHFSFAYARLFPVDFPRQTVAHNQSISEFTALWL